MQSERQLLRRREACKAKGSCSGALSRQLFPGLLLEHVAQSGVQQRALVSLARASVAAKRHHAARVFLRCFLSALSPPRSLLAVGLIHGRRRKTRDAQRGTSCGPCTVQPPALPAPELAASRSRALCVKTGGLRRRGSRGRSSPAAVGFQALPKPSPAVRFMAPILLCKTGPENGESTHCRIDIIEGPRSLIF